MQNQPKDPKNIQCVIFDMDGVIIDSECIHKKAYYDTFHSLGLDVPETLYKTITGSSTLNAFQKLVAHFQLDNEPSDLVTLEASKPHPEIFEKAAALGNTPRENCIVIEDSDNGITAANKADIFVFGYANPMCSDQTLENANQIISDFTELKAYI